MALRDQFLIRTYVSFWDEAEVGRAAEFTVAIENDPQRPLACNLLNEVMNHGSGPTSSPRSCFLLALQ
jgi:hypothetical protein